MLKEVDSLCFLLYHCSMNKLKSFLCALLTFITCAVLFVGCGAEQPAEPNTPPAETESIISLTDAANVIQSALAINGNANHNVLEKIGTFDFTEQIELVDEQTTPEDRYMEGVCQYANDDFVTYYAEVSQELGNNETHEICFVDGVEYKYSGDEVYEQTTPEISALEVINIAVSEDAFNAVYDSEVKKVTNTDGISYTLKSDLKGFFKLVYLMRGQSIGEDFEQQWLELKNKLPQAILDECYVSVTIKFDSHETIIGVELDWLYVMSEDCFKYQENHSISRTTKQVTQPQWLTDYLANNN